MKQNLQITQTIIPDVSRLQIVPLVFLMKDEQQRLFYLINNLHIIHRTGPCKLINISRCCDTGLAVSALWVINYFKLSLDTGFSGAALKSPPSLLVFKGITRLY